MDNILTIGQMKWHHDMSGIIPVNFQYHWSTPSYLFYQKCKNLHFKFPKFAHPGKMAAETRKWSIVHQGCRLHVKRGNFEISPGVMVFSRGLQGFFQGWSCLPGIFQGFQGFQGLLATLFNLDENLALVTLTIS